MPASESVPQALWLFDIDGTLVEQSAEQLAAWTAALRSAFGVEVPPEAVTPHLGGMFAEVVRAVLRPLGRDASAGAIERALAAYLAHVRGALAVRPPRALPGGHELVLALRKRGHRVGVVTGNFADEGEPKLAAVGVRHLLDLAVYADLTVVAREDLVRRALALARAQGFEGGFADTVVVGDSVHDVQSARRTGARAVAVCTGVAPRAALTAAGPDALHPDLSALLRALESGCPANPASPRSA